MQRDAKFMETRSRKRRVSIADGVKYSCLGNVTKDVCLFHLVLMLLLL